MIEKVALVVDVLILAWLVATWFYEGHHRRCSVEMKCPRCGETTDTGCASGRQEESHGQW